MMPVLLYAQSTQKLRGIPHGAIFYDKNGKGVSSARSAAYYRVLATDAQHKKILMDFYMNGQLKSEKHYITFSRFDDKATVLNGMVRTFFPSGRVESIMMYTHGKANGRAISFFPDGSVGMKLCYRNGVLDGTTCVYDKNGMLEHTEVWKNGSKVSEQRGGRDPYINRVTNEDPFVDQYRKDEVTLMRQAAAGQASKPQSHLQAATGAHKSAVTKPTASASTTQPAVAAKPAPVKKEQPAVANRRPSRAQAVDSLSLAQWRVVASLSPLASNKRKSENLRKQQVDRALNAYMRQRHPAPAVSQHAPKAAETPQPSAVQAEIQQPVAAAKHFDLQKLLTLLLNEQTNTHPEDYFAAFAHRFGVARASKLNIFGNLQELCYTRDMTYDAQSGKDVITGDHPRQISFQCMKGADGLYTLRCINVYTSDASEYRALADDALKAQFSVLGGEANAQSDSFVMNRINKQAYTTSKIIAMFSHLPNAYAGMYHISFEVK